MAAWLGVELVVVWWYVCDLVGWWGYRVVG